MSSVLEGCSYPQQNTSRITKAAEEAHMKMRLQSLDCLSRCRSLCLLKEDYSRVIVTLDHFHALLRLHAFLTVQPVLHSSS